MRQIAKSFWICLTALVLPLVAWALSLYVLNGALQKMNQSLMEIPSTSSEAFSMNSAIVEFNLIVVVFTVFSLLNIVFMGVALCSIFIMGGVPPVVSTQNPPLESPEEPTSENE